MARPVSAKEKRIYGYQLGDNLRYGKKHYYFNFKDGRQPIITTASAGFTALETAGAGTFGAAQTSQMYNPGDGFIWDYYSNTAQTLAPTITATGLDIAGDLVDNETQEFVPGGNNANSRLAFVAGTDPDFFFKCKFKLTDADGSDQFGIGFRKQEAFTAATSFLSTGDALYTDFVLFGFAGTVANPNPVRWSADQANSGSSTVGAVNFTWADTLVHELQIQVRGSKPILFINGIRIGNPIAKDGDGGAITSQSTTGGNVLTGSTPYQFTAGLNLIPFIFLRHDAAVSEATVIVEGEIGHLRDEGKDPGRE